MKQRIARAYSLIADRYGQFVYDHRSIVVVAIQLALIFAANLTAFALRFDAHVPPPYDQMIWRYMPAVIVIFGSGLWIFGIQRGLWRYVGLHDLGRIFWASVAGSTSFYLLFHVFLGNTEYPRSIIILTGLLSGLYLAGVRLGVRWFREWLRVLSPSARRVVIVGAGNAAELLVRDMLSQAQSQYRPVGLVDDDPIKRRMKIHGVPVVGRIEDLSQITHRLIAHEIIVAVPSASNELKRRIIASAEGCKVPIKLLPSVTELLADPAAMRQIRPMSLEDLLQRDAVTTESKELHGFLTGKRVLVTGAGGSIGSELCRQIAHYGPAVLVLLDRYENGLYALDLEIRAQFPGVKALAAVGDVAVQDRVSEIMAQTHPEIVFHAAAHKHVPLMEGNPKEAMRNNVQGTKIIAEAAIAEGVERFVLISTDKAVNPTSVMGATKRVAEELVQLLNGRNRTKFTVVRFGNVLGSNGSVVPLFSEQIRRGGPVTVTHPDIRRFFMTIPEAVQLVLQASLLGRGGDVFVLDMGDQIKVGDLAKNMIVLSGLVPNEDIRIVYTGLRPGEKLFEELFEESEQVEPTAHPKIQRAVRRDLPVFEGLERLMVLLETGIGDLTDDTLIQYLQTVVPSYQPMNLAKVQTPS